MKQRSHLWYKLCREAKVTGSPLYKGLGLDTLKLKKEHFEEFILKENPKPFSEEVQKMIDYGTKNEVLKCKRSSVINVLLAVH